MVRSFAVIWKLLGPVLSEEVGIGYVYDAVPAVWVTSSIDPTPSCWSEYSFTPECESDAADQCSEGEEVALYQEESDVGRGR